MLEFFNQETLQYPPAMAKGDLVKCILPDSITSTTDAQPKATGSVLVGSVLANLVKPKKNQSFKYYSSEVFYTQIRKHQDLHVADWVDVVFDTYKKQSLKTTKLVKRGKVFAGKCKRIQWRQRTGKVSFV